MISRYIRPASAAGRFYAGYESELREEVDGFVAGKLGTPAAKPAWQPECQVPKRTKAIMVPHAGYYYSGSVAGPAYRQLKEQRMNSVYLICNSHTAYFSGILIDDSYEWETPLGKVGVDLEMARKLVQETGFTNLEFLPRDVHRSDHTLEVQLPFLQTVLEPGFRIIPMLFGNEKIGPGKIEPSQVLADALIRNLRPDDLIVISSDMSHYPTSEDARLVDLKTLEIIKGFNIAALDRHIRKNEGKIPNEQTLLCGIDGVKTAMLLAEKLKWHPEVIGYQNSGDVSGDRKRVVGYGAIAWKKE